MGKSSETYNKKEKEKKRLKKHQEKKEKAEIRKTSSSKGKGLEGMMAYVDEDGNLTSSPPDPDGEPTPVGSPAGHRTRLTRALVVFSASF